MEGKGSPAASGHELLLVFLWETEQRHLDQASSPRSLSGLPRRPGRRASACQVVVEEEGGEQARERR